MTAGQRVGGKVASIKVCESSFPEGNVEVPGCAGSASAGRTDSTEGQCVRTKVINLIKGLTARALELFLGLTGKQDEKFDILSVAW